MADVNGAPVGNDGGMSEDAGDMEADISQLNDAGQPLSDLALEILADDREERVQAKKAKAGPPEAPNDQGDDEDDATDEAEPAPKAKKEPESFKLKVGDKTYTRTKEQLIADAQRGLALQAKSNSLADKEKSLAQAEQQYKHGLAQLRERMDKLEQSPEEFLRKSPKAEEIAEKLLLERAQQWQREQQMTPQELEHYREAQSYKAKLAEFEKAQKAQEESQSERLVEEQKEKIAHVFGEALQKHNLPKNTTTLRVMAGIFQAHINKGVQLTEEQCAALTRAQLEQINTDAFGNMDAASFVQKHPKLADAVRKHFVSLAKGGQVKPTETQQAKPKVSRERTTGKFQKEEQDPWEREIEELKARGAKERQHMEKQPWRAPIIG